MYLKFHVRDTVGTKLVTADYENFQDLVFGYFNAFVFVVTLYKQQTRVVNILNTIVGLLWALSHRLNYSIGLL